MVAGVLVHAAAATRRCLGRFQVAGVIASDKKSRHRASVEYADAGQCSQERRYCGRWIDRWGGYELHSDRGGGWNQTLLKARMKYVERALKLRALR